MLTSTFTLAGNTAVSGTGVWTIQSGAGTITDASSPTTTVTGVTAGQTTILRWTITNGSCSSFDEVSLTNDVAVTVAAAGTDQAQCATSTFTLAGNTAVSGTGVWTIQSGAGAITDASSPTTTVTGVTAGQTTILRWTITNGTCSSFDEVSLTNDVAVTVAAAGTDQAQCATSTFTLAGNTAVSGTGVWTIQSGAGTITDASSPTTTVTGVTAGQTTVLRWTITNGSCSSFDEVSLTNDVAVTVAAAGTDQAQCATSTFTLAGNTAVSGTGVWTIQSGAGAITDASSPTTTVTGVTAGQTTVLRWTITNGSCSSNDEVSLTNDVAVTVAAAGQTRRSVLPVHLPLQVIQPCQEQVYGQYKVEQVRSQMPLHRQQPLQVLQRVKQQSSAGRSLMVHVQVLMKYPDQ
ncbi:MAG: hypothetical protein IPP73_12615 [Chitinophagaceae bacterium]|nr:hypothetical protein [Chitinophagaceae bacterium]